jgi:hypothetical protein
MLGGGRTVVDRKGDAAEGPSNLPVRSLLQGLEWVYDRALDGLLGRDASLEQLAQAYRTRFRSDDKTIASLIFWHTAMAGVAGFVTGLGGILALPAAIPANLAGVLYIQIRMIGAIAHLRGHDLSSDQVRTLVLACLAGSAALDILKDVGIKIGTQMSRQMILRISGELLKRINQAVGFRLVTKAGSRGVVNLVKAVPLVGGLVGGAVDATATKIVGETAKRVFVPVTPWSPPEHGETVPSAVSA